MALLRGLLILLVLFLAILIRDRSCVRTLSLNAPAHSVVAYDVERRERAIQTTRKWYTLAFRGPQALELNTDRESCSDPFRGCEATIGFTLSKLSSLQVSVSALVEGSESPLPLRCNQHAHQDVSTHECRGEIPQGAVVRGFALVPTSVDADPTFNRLRVEAPQLVWSTPSQVLSIGGLFVTGAILLASSITSRGGLQVAGRLAQGFAAMLALCTVLQFPRVCRPDSAASVVGSDGLTYYIINLPVTGSYLMLTLRESVAACGVLCALMVLLVVCGRGMRGCRQEEKGNAATPSGMNGITIGFVVAALSAPLAMGGYPKALFDVWALTLTVVSVILSYGFLSAIRFNVSRSEESISKVLNAWMASGQWVAIAVPCILAGGVVVLLNSWLFSGQPLLVDSRVPLVYAERLLSGVLAPSIDDASFNIVRGYIYVRDGAWFPIQPPGHLVLLGFSQLIGLAKTPGLIGLVVSWVCFIVLARTVQLSRMGFGVAATLFITSPSVLLMHAEYMNHISAEMYLLIALIAVYRLADSTAASLRYWSLAFGLAAGALVMTRPLTAVGMVLPLVVWLACFPHLRKFRTWGAGVIGLLPGVLLYLLYNKVSTGSYLISGYEAEYGPSHNPGFGIDPKGELFSLDRGLARFLGQFLSLSTNAFIIPIPLILIAFVSFSVQRLRPLLASALGLPLAYLIYWHDGGPFFAPRFLFESIAPWCILSGGCVSIFVAWLQRISEAHQRRRVLSVLGVLVVFYVAVSVAFPIRDTLRFYKTTATERGRS